MAYTTARARYESSLERAFRALNWAADAAEELKDEGAELDCRAIQREVVRLAEASLKGKPARQQIKGQLKLHA